MKRFIQTLPLAFAAATCALIAVVVDYTAGPRTSMFNMVADSFSILDLTSVLMGFWALTFSAACLLRLSLQRSGWDGFFFVVPTLFGLGAAITEILNMLDGARMFGDAAGAQIFMLYERRLVLALAFLAATMFALTVQLVFARPDVRPA